MRRVDVADALAAAEVDHLAVAAARAAARSAMSLSDTMQPVCPCADLRLRRDRQPLVHRAALVGLEVAEGDPAQAFGRDEAADGVAG